MQAESYYDLEDDLDLDNELDLQFRGELGQGQPPCPHIKVKRFAQDSPDKRTDKRMDAYLPATRSMITNESTRASVHPPMTCPPCQYSCLRVKSCHTVTLLSIRIWSLGGPACFPRTKSAKYCFNITSCTDFMENHFISC